MKKIILVSLSTPTAYNLRAASALPFHLMRGAQEAMGEGNIQFEIYSFNSNHVSAEDIRQTEEQLGTTVHVLATPRWQQWLFRLRLLVLRVLLRYPLGAYYRLPRQVVEEIRAKQPDTLWLYGEELCGLAKHFPGMKLVCTMPDCESMYYHRLLRKRFATRRLSQVLRYAFAYWQYRGMERDHYDPRVTYHFVGKADQEFFSEINPGSRAVFLRHPASPVPSDRRGAQSLSRERTEASSGGRKMHTPIRIVIPGRYDLYQKEAVDEVVDVLCHQSSVVNRESSETEDRRLKTEDSKLKTEDFTITFLGKSWDAPAEKLRNAGWTVTIKTWVDDYAAELRQHDVALYPISVGTGTKGRVLDAFANGLLVVGTPFALENIDCGDGAICYQRGGEISEVLGNISARPSFYEEKARLGQQRVMKAHDRSTIAKNLF